MSCARTSKLRERDHRDEVPRDADQHEEDATGGGEVQQPPWIADEQDHRSWVLQDLLEPHVAAAIVSVALVARHPPVLQHLRKAGFSLADHEYSMSGP
ncbi:hypothetical protein X777_06714 [Ooceraea biroi]|uniref:Uncharacterized protein n=1 Tax=Ooceraea biroi TaxID=2015173 RepID=A0A026X1T1_OOCBI|nr:hypothetical protein X777_06714 [Ooceraea biroi]